MKCDDTDIILCSVDVCSLLMLCLVAAVVS
jgi:hypothetical protein